MSIILEKLFVALPELKDLHAHEKKSYLLLKNIARQEIEKLFSSENPFQQDFAPFGTLVFPYCKMGAVDSLNLFDLDELIIFSFYWQNRNRYRCVADIGANIGLHSILLNKCGYSVRSYEPEKNHFKMLEKNIALNQCTTIESHNKAVSDNEGEMEFVRVLGNTTGSHLAGSKQNPYGQLERYPVKMESILGIINWADLIKLDAEGHEKQIILATKHEHWMNTDALIEVENSNNAIAIYSHFNKIGVNLFSQKNGWQKVTRIEDIPTSYKEGTLFASCKNEMPWG